MHKVPRQKLYEFAEKNEEFNDTIKELIDKKEAQLERLALEKGIDNTMAIFSLKQLGWKDRTETEHTGTVGIKLVDDIPGGVE
jgi:predicted CopG family antitoxin